MPVAYKPIRVQFTSTSRRKPEIIVRWLMADIAQSMMCTVQCNFVCVRANALIRGPNTIANSHMTSESLALCGKVFILFGFCTCEQFLNAFLRCWNGRAWWYE